MSYDACACKGYKLDLSVICSLCEKCKRYIIGKKAKEYVFPMLWTKPPYKDGKCELFIEVKEKQNEKEI